MLRDLHPCRGRKREENRASLDGILEALNLNGSNPIAVMTQDISRSFLAGSNEKSDRKKFDIYMEATLLAHSQENYQVGNAMLLSFFYSFTKDVATAEQILYNLSNLLNSSLHTNLHAHPHAQ